MSYRYSGIHVVMQLMRKNTREFSGRFDMLTRCVTCKVYLNLHVPLLRAKSNFLQNIDNE